MQKTRKISSIPKKDSSFFGHPTGIFVLSSIEIFERFSFFGLRAMLLMYMTVSLHYSDSNSLGIFSSYVSLLYVTPLIGGYLADQIIGFKSGVIMGCVIMAIGHFCLGLMPFGEYFFYLGLGFIITGTGFFKANMSSSVGMLYKDKNKSLKDAGYTIFYFAINIGSIFAPIVCGYVRHEYGWHYGFGIAGLGMLIGAVIALTQKKYFSHIDKGPSSKSYWLVAMGGIISGPLFACILYHHEKFCTFFPFVGLVFALYIGKIILQCNAEEREKIFTLIVGLVVYMFSFALILQQDMVVVLFIKRNVNKIFLGQSLKVEYFQSINPLTVLSLAGIFSYVWTVLAKKGKDLQPASKFALAFLLSGVAFFILFMGCISGQSSDGLSPAWYVIAGLVLGTIAEILTFPIMLSLTSKISPDRFKGVMMASSMLGISFASLIAKYLSNIAAIPAQATDDKSFLLQSIGIYGNTFKIFTVIAIGGFVLTVLVGLWMNKTTKKYS